MTGHKSSWETLGFSLLRRKCLSCILMTRREPADLRARESLLCRGRHMCITQGWGWADWFEERCSAPGVHREGDYYGMCDGRVRGGLFQSWT